MEAEKENPDGNAALVNSFCEITSSSIEEALFFLESHNFELDADIEVTHTVTFWRNGFSVNDGPLRTVDHPQNAPFLESIKKSECPKELEAADRGTAVHVNLTRRDEDYPEPVKPCLHAFQGVVRTLVSTSCSSAEPSQTTGASRCTAPLPTMGLVVDESHRSQ